MSIMQKVVLTTSDGTEFAREQINEAIRHERITNIRSAILPLLPYGALRLDPEAVRDLATFIYENRVVIGKAIGPERPVAPATPPSPPPDRTASGAEVPPAKPAVSAYDALDTFITNMENGK